MGNQLSRILVWGLLILVSISCVTINIGQQSAAPVNNNDSIQMTVQAIQGGWNQGNNPTAIPTSGSFASLNNYSATPTGDNYASPPPPQDSSSANQPQQTLCLLLGKVRDITVADGYQMDPGSTANKTWELTNGGSCSWDANFQIVDAGGTLPKTVQTKAIGKSVAPGGTVQVTVPVVAPNQAGTYTANYKIRSSSGEVFGSGANATSAFWVSIAVISQPQPQPPSTPEVVINWNASKYTWVGISKCPTKPYDPVINITLTSKKDRTITYNFRLNGTQTYPAPQTSIVCSSPSGNNNYIREVKANQPISVSATFTGCAITNYVEGTIRIVVYQKNALGSTKLIESTIPFAHTCVK